jgi:two-component system LytT family response regulator
MDRLLKSILVDDEPHNISNLLHLLESYCPEIEVAGTANTVQEAIDLLHLNAVDLIFLDIDLGSETGFDLLKKINRQNFEVIFVTAFSEYGIKAIKFSAIDYLLKPVQPDELQIAVKKAVEKNNTKTQNKQIQSLLQILQNQQAKEMHRIALPSSKETRLVSPEDIVRCESNNNYTRFHLRNGEILLISRPIYEYESLLNDYGFIRCHQSHLVNKAFIKSLLKTDQGLLLLENGEHIPVSKMKKDLVKSLFTN